METNTENKKLILDYSKWRCGGQDNLSIPNGNKIGTGYTQMCNEDGFKCCLGLFAPQLNPNIKDKDLLGQPFPEDVSRKIRQEIPGLSYFDDDCGYYHNTSLADEAYVINDDEKTTPQEKIKLLKELFGEHGYEIEVVNMPEEA